MKSKMALEEAYYSESHIYYFSFRHTYVLDHASCVLKSMVKFFSTLLFFKTHYNVNSCQIVSYQKGSYFPSFYMEIITLFETICFCVCFPHQIDSNFVSLLPSAVPAHNRHSLTIKRERERSSNWVSRIRAVRKTKKKIKTSWVLRWLPLAHGLWNLSLDKRKLKTDSKTHIFLQSLFCKCVHIVNYIPFHFRM